MEVIVEAGTYRISGVTYTCAEQNVTIGAAPSTNYYRMDLIQIGIDGAADCKAGTPATSDPVAPTADTGHIALGTVLVPSGAITIPSQYVNVEWTTPEARAITVVPTDDDLASDEASTTVRVKVIDQYGNGIVTDSPGWYLQLEILYGNGEVSSSEEGSSTGIIGGHTGSNSYYDFTYTRDQLATDESPMLRGILGLPLSQAYVFITVRDADGNVMGQNYSNPDTFPLLKSNINLALFPEYPGAVMTPSGSNNDPGTLGMTSDFESISNTIYNYYQWLSDAGTLQSYDINVKIPIPSNFIEFQVGTNVALTVDVKTEENVATNNKIDITLRKDGSAATSVLSAQISASAATWLTVGFDETATVLASLVADDILNVTFRLYSNGKYARIGKINLQIKVL
jgi:hypothetical protein